jgi:outer membrane protein OmpA-like peptidoglycan-associated protein
MWLDRRVPSLAALLTGALVVGCSSTVPAELVQARSAYNSAVGGPAVTYAPAQLYVAKQSLIAAEDQFNSDGDSQRTRDRAYVAIRKAQLAEAQARVAQANVAATAAEQQVTLTQARTLAQTQDQLRQAQAMLVASDAPAQELARFGAVTKDSRGTVLTLSGGIFFPTGEATLSARARTRLGELADALTKVDPESKIDVDGFTDSTGSEESNMALSDKRARAVRDLLVSRGVAKDRIASQGFGPAEPVASNASPEGRANNRRVEIVIKNNQKANEKAP